MSNDVRGDEGRKRRRRSESEGKGVDAERPTRSGRDEEKWLPGRVAAGDILSHVQEVAKRGRLCFTAVCALASCLFKQEENQHRRLSDFT